MSDDDIFESSGIELHSRMGKKFINGAAIAAENSLEQPGLELLLVWLQISDGLSALRDEPDAGPEEDGDDGADGGGGGDGWGGREGRMGGWGRIVRTPARKHVPFELRLSFIPPPHGVSFLPSCESKKKRFFPALSQIKFIYQ